MVKTKNGFMRYVLDYIARNHPGHQVIKIDKDYAYCVKEEARNELH